MTLPDGAVFDVITGIKLLDSGTEEVADEPVANATLIIKKIPSRDNNVIFFILLLL
ncbi:hypothetical protein D3C78_1728360 [compost metagenome]